MSTVEQFIWVNLYSLDLTLLFPSQDLETFEKECTYLKVQYFAFQIDYHVLLMPVKGSSNGGFYGIMEFLRNEGDSPFYDEDEEIVNSYMGGLWKIKLIRINYRISANSFCRNYHIFLRLKYVDIFI